LSAKRPRTTGPVRAGPGSKTVGRWWIEAAVALARRPDLWPTAFAQTLTLARKEWWRRWPFAPVPAADWMAFRMETAYGDADARPSAADLVAWLEWCRVSRPGPRLR